MKKLNFDRFAFAFFILCVMFADIALALLGIDEVLVVAILCVCVALVIAHDLLERRNDKKPSEEIEVMDLEDFFKKGGFAYRWNKGDKERKKCLTLESLLDGKETDYAELWLGNTRYYIKDTKDE